MDIENHRKSLDISGRPQWAAASALRGPAPARAPCGAGAPGPGGRRRAGDAASYGEAKTCGKTGEQVGIWKVTMKSIGKRVILSNS